MQLLDIILKPYLTEKTTVVRSEHEKEVIAFVVNPKASKHDIKNAFMAIYNIKPEKINTINRKPVAVKTGTRVPGYTKLMKIAYITLPVGIKLAVTKDEVDSAKEAMSEQKESKVKKIFNKIIGKETKHEEKEDSLKADKATKSVNKK